MFGKLRKSTQSLSTSTPVAQQEDVPYWATLKSIYLASLAKTNRKKAKRRLRRQVKCDNGTVDTIQTPHARIRSYPVEIIGKLPPDGIPRPPSFIYTAPIKRFQVTQPKMPSYADDCCTDHTRLTQFFPEDASVHCSRHSIFSNIDDPFSASPSQPFFENARVQYSLHASGSSRIGSSTVHVQPVLEDWSLPEPPSNNSDPSRESTCPFDSASVYSQESTPRSTIFIKAHDGRISQSQDNSSSDSGTICQCSSFTARHLRNHNHLSSDVLTTPTVSHYSPEALLIDHSSAHAIPTRDTVSTASDEISAHRSSSCSDASLYSQANIGIPRSLSHSRLNRSSISTVNAVKQDTNGQDIGVLQSYSKKISQNDDSDSDSDSDAIYDEDDSNSVSSVSSASSAETAFYSCDDEAEDEKYSAEAEKNVIHKARADVLAVAKALKDRQKQRTSMEIKFREDVVKGVAKVFAEAAAHGKAKQRHLAPIKCKSYYSFLSLHDKREMPGAFVLSPKAKGRSRSVSTAKLL